MKKVVSSTILSALVFPGAGQLNNRHYLKGSIMIVAVLSALIVFFIKVYKDVLRNISSTGQDKINADIIGQLSIQVQQQHADIIKQLMMFLLIIWIYAIIDAYVYGKKIDQK